MSFASPAGRPLPITPSLLPGCRGSTNLRPHRALDHDPDQVRGMESSTRTTSPAVRSWSIRSLIEDSIVCGQRHRGRGDHPERGSTLFGRQPHHKCPTVRPRVTRFPRCWANSTTKSCARFSASRDHQVAEIHDSRRARPAAKVAASRLSDIALQGRPVIRRPFATSETRLVPFLLPCKRNICYANKGFFAALVY